MPRDFDDEPEFSLHGQTPTEDRLDDILGSDEVIRAKRAVFDAIGKGDTRGALQAMTTLEEHLGFNAFLIKSTDPDQLNPIQAAHEAGNDELEAALKLRRDLAWDQSEAAARDRDKGRKY